MKSNTAKHYNNKSEILTRKVFEQSEIKKNYMENIDSILQNAESVAISSSIHAIKERIICPHKFESLFSNLINEEFHCYFRSSEARSQ